MIKAYAVGIKLECNGVTCLDYVSFYSKRSDAKTDIKEHRKTGEKEAFVIPIEIKEKYESEKENKRLSLKSFQCNR